MIFPLFIFSHFISNPDLCFFSLLLDKKQAWRPACFNTQGSHTLTKLEIHTHMHEDWQGKNIYIIKYIFVFCLSSTTGHAGYF